MADSFLLEISRILAKMITECTSQSKQVIKNVSNCANDMLDSMKPTLNDIHGQVSCSVSGGDQFHFFVIDPAYSYQSTPNLFEKMHSILEITIMGPARIFRIYQYLGTFEFLID